MNDPAPSNPPFPGDFPPQESHINWLMEFAMAGVVVGFLLLVRWWARRHPKRDEHDHAADE